VNKTVAWVLSVLFHPLLLPTFLFSVILYYLPGSFITFPAESRWIILVFVFLATFLLPVIGVYYLFRLGHVRSLSLADRAERSLPLFFTGVCYALVSYLFYRDDMFDRLFFFVLGLITVQVFLTYIFSLFWKISAHSVGAGGTIGMLVILNSLLAENYLLPLIVAFIVIAGAVMSARLALNAHTSEEVYGGFVLGFSFTVGVWLVSQ
jgi:membrane-associated phospholipid phosphatase